jgi:myo-inositol catabolism protein IolC
MPLGYDQTLYILAFDHRGSFQKKFGIKERPPTDEETERIRDAKRLIFEGVVTALDTGAAQPQATGVLVDEQYGSDIPQRAKEGGLKLAMPVEKSGQDEFDFEYGDAFGEHIERFDPDFSKVLVRYNPEADAGMNERQLGRLKTLSDWLHERDRKFLFELLVPAEPAQLESVGGDEHRYDAEVRPGLMIEAIKTIQDAGVEADIWKIEGLETKEDCERVALQTRAGGRDGVACVLLGRGADDAKVDHWLYQAAPTPGFVGFAIGRSIWNDALTGYLDGSLDREKATASIAEKYHHFVETYQRGE